MIKKEIGRFYAFTFDNHMYEFIVFDNNTIDCLSNGSVDYNSRAVNCTLMELSPRFVMHCDGYCYVNNTSTKTSKGLIKQYAINDELFDYLLANGMIKYSCDVAYLYDFKVKEGYDRKLNAGKPFKWAIKKGPVLVKQKKGYFR